MLINGSNSPPYYPTTLSGSPPKEQFPVEVKPKKTEFSPITVGVVKILKAEEGRSADLTDKQFKTFSNPILNEKDYLSHKELEKPAKTLMKVKELDGFGMFSNKKVCRDFVSAISQFKKQLKEISDFSYPKCFEAQVDGKDCRLEVYESKINNKKIKEIILAFVSYKKNAYIGKTFANGGFKDFYEGWLVTQKPTKVVYCLSPNLNDSDNKLNALSEARFLKKFNKSSNEDIVKAYKNTFFNLKGNSEQVVIMEHYPFCLFDIIVELSHGFLKIDDRKKIELALQLAKNVKFLHKENVIHRDLKPDNILLNNKYKPLLCDFGLAHKVKDEGELNKLKGTFDYAPYDALEAIKTNSTLNLHSTESFAPDIWALGCLLWTLFSHQGLYWSLTDEEKNKYSNIACVNATLSRLNTLYKMTFDKKSILYLLMQILQKKPSSRPSIDMIIQMLENYLENLPKDKSTNSIYEEFLLLYAPRSS